MTAYSEVIHHKKPYLELLKKEDGSKICDDIALPKGTAPFYISPNNEILLQRFFAPVNDNEEEGHVFYWARLVGND